MSIAATILSLCRQWTYISHRSTSIVVADSDLPLPIDRPRPIQDKDGRRRVTGFLPVPNRTIQASKWAYAYLMAGVDTAHPSYLGIFYNVLVSAQILRDNNNNNNSNSSTADIVVMVQMSANSTSHRLIPREEELLTLSQVRIYYLDSIPPQQSFYTMQMEKFRILEMTEYERVLYLDGDVMPYCSMDYLFELSTKVQPNESGAAPTPLLKENVILAWRIEPAHGGAFLLAPRKGDFEKLQDIVHRQERQILSGHGFSKKEGWGHVITPPDAWHSTSGREGLNATDWDWHGDFADQGLLYFWTKYYKRNVSIVIGKDVENWSGNHSELLHGPLNSYGCVPKEYTKPYKYASSGFSKMVPYRDFKHFTGQAKPWVTSGGVNMTNTHRFEDVQTAQEYWFYLFRKIQRRFQLLVDVNDVHRQIPLTQFGGYPTIHMAHATARAKFESQ
jgi:alpha-N-acetylglucosamine transferase